MKTCTNRIPDNCDSYECGRPEVRAGRCAECLPGAIAEARTRLRAMERATGEARARLRDLEGDTADHAKRLAEIGARERAATKGPWPSEPGWNNGGTPSRTWRIPARQDGAEVEMLAEDALFVEHAREDVPWLLAEHRAASDALTAAGIPDDGRALAERVKALAAVAGRAERARRTAIASHNVGAPFNPDALFGQELRVYPAPATVADRCDACGRASLLGLDHDYHPEPDIEPAEPPVDRAALVGLPSTAETTADPWLDEPLTSEEQAAIAAAEATPGAGEPW